MKQINPKILGSAKVFRPAYSDRMSYIMSKFSEFAYIEYEKKEEELENILNMSGFQIVECFNKKDSQGFLAHNNHYAILSFRGTEGNLADIKTDLKCS